jgi:hypothetical protein
MPIEHQAFTVGTTATLIAQIPEGNPKTSVFIYNNDNSQIYIGDSAVTVSGVETGLHIAKQTVFEIELNAEDKLYAVSAAGTSANAVVTLFSRVI